MTLSKVGGTLPNFFPSVGPVTRYVLFADFSKQNIHPPKDAWSAELEVLVRQGLAGLARRIIREHDLKVPLDVIQKLEEVAFDDTTSTAIVVRSSQQGLGALQAAGIPFVITKGAGIAKVYTSVSDRPFVDLDVLVPPDKFVQALQVLFSAGYEEDDKTRQPWRSLDRYCREATNLRSGEGGSIDLHHRISPWLWSTGLSFDLLASDARYEEVYGIESLLVSPVHNLFITALHVVSDKSKPGQNYRIWRDLLILLSVCPFDVIVEMSTETGLREWLLWILRCFPGEVQPADLINRLAEHEGRLHGSWRLRMMLPPRFGSRHLLGQVFRLPAPNAALFTAGMLIPSAHYLRNRYPDKRLRYLTWWRALPDNFSQETDAYA